jgi:hypothetical protein
VLPVKRIYWSLLMSHEYSTRALVELMQIGKTPSGADPVLQHAPEAFNIAGCEFFVASILLASPQAEGDSII